MPMLKNLVVYASETGNTKKLAEEIYIAIPGKDKEIVDVRSWNGKLDAENYYVGFWANRGSCSLEIIDILSSLRFKNVALFGTCGMGNSKNYYDSLEQNVKVWLSDDNNYLGAYMCRGKMQHSILEKYESYRGKLDDNKLDLMISYYEDSLSHPDNQDFLKAHIFVEKCIDAIKDAGKQGA